MQRDVLAPVTGNDGEAETLEKTAQQVGIGSRVLHELETVGAHGIRNHDGPPKKLVTIVTNSSPDRSHHWPNDAASREATPRSVPALQTFGAVEHSEFGHRGRVFPQFRALHPGVA